MSCSKVSAPIDSAAAGAMHVIRVLEGSRGDMPPPGIRGRAAISRFVIRATIW